MELSDEEYQKKREAFFDEYFKILQSKEWIEVEKNYSDDSIKISFVPDVPCRLDPTVTRAEYREAWERSRPKW